MLTKFVKNHLRYQSSHYIIDVLIVLKDSLSWYECESANKFDPVLKIFKEHEGKKAQNFARSPLTCTTFHYHK
jgi:hypothetical protein